MPRTIAAIMMTRNAAVRTGFTTRTPWHQAPPIRKEDGSGGRHVARVRHRHDLNVVLGEAGLEQTVGKERESVLDGRVERLAEVAGQDRALGPDRADVVEQPLPGDLAGVRRREAPFQQRSPLREAPLRVRVELL